MILAFYLIIQMTVAVIEATFVIIVFAVELFVWMLLAIAALLRVMWEAAAPEEDAA